MAYKNFNLNPAGRHTEDCAVRALAAALNMSWKEIYTGLCEQGFWLCDMPCANRVWKTYLIGKGWKRKHMQNLTEEEKEFLHLVHTNREVLLERLEKLGLLEAFLQAENGTT